MATNPPNTPPTPPTPRAKLKPGKAAVTASIKKHLTTAYPGAQINSGSAGFSVFLPPIGSEPDFIIRVSTGDEMKAMVYKLHAAKENAAAKKQQAQRAAEAKRRAAAAKARAKPKVSAKPRKR